ncbi:MAG: asparagine synthase (glutamine-hydrolyzing), partial [Chloroflexota bacterium]|nr:asparagine synthase (glutamine-hydrolyzing) [Chloroflexota bacterium]
SPDVLRAMTETLVHRGPDEAGFWEGEGASLGMRRLSIVDLALGHQPVCNEDETIWAVFNGEIYNHLELRAGLERRGHRFRSDHSDSEVLVHLYEDHGPAFLDQLNGMFAIALWDANRQELHLARDRAGKKPLYFTWAGGHFLFGSEIKALLRHPDVSPIPNLRALHHYFTFKNVPAPLSAFEGIEQLRPGERAVVKRNHIQRERWWRLRFQEDPGITEREAAQHIRELLTDSVRLRMRTDVPFGAYLSGGVDSSSVVALMAHLGASRLKTFSLVYEDDFANKTADREFASQVSRMCNTDHYEYVMTHSDLTASTEAILAAFDEPFSGVTSTYFLTRLISQHVRVAISGDGADELFASYLPHRLAQPLHFLETVGEPSAVHPTSLAPYHDETEFLGRLLELGDETA